MAKRKRVPHTVSVQGNNLAVSPAEKFLHRALVHVTGAMGLFISISFFTGTYDTAQVKLTLLHLGGFLLVALWGSLKILQRKSPFSHRDLLFLLPVFAYVLWNILCFVFAPLHLEAAEEFIRFLLYSFITLSAATEFTYADIKTITRWFLAAVWISFIYAAVQVIDGFFPGFDPMPWRGWFTKRIFSTHANPNFFADFVIFASGILGAVYLSTRQKKYAALGILGAVLLFFTESKGAWLAYIVTIAAGVLLYANYGSSAIKKHVKKINVLALVAVLYTAILAGAYTAKRFQSVSFRTHTWLGTFEIVKESPVMGVGIGNFKTIYTAHRRPQIFYIEKSSNTETQHAENELLEQWAVSGSIGLAIFLWMMLFVFTLAWRTLKEPEKNEKFPYVLGYTVALAGMFIHSFVDISIHLASSGFFFALFIGFLLALCRPAEKSLSTIDETMVSRGWLLGGIRLLIFVGLGWLVVWMSQSFYEITSVMGATNLGEKLLLDFSWVVFLACLCAGSFIVVRAAWLTKQALALLPLLLLIPLEAAAFCPFRANHFYSLGIAFYNQRNLEGSIGFFTKAVALNPLQAEYRQFRGNVLAAVFDLTKQFSPIRGDKKEPSDDFSRALADFALVEKHSPNHALLYHNRGQLYFNMALLRSQAAGQARSAAEYAFLTNEARENMKHAKQSFLRALQTDPVNPETYMFLVRISLLERDLTQAQKWLDIFRQGPAGVTEPEFLQQNQTYPLAQQLQTQINQLRRTVGVK